MGQWVQACKDRVRIARRCMRELTGSELRAPIQHRCKVLRLGSTYGGWSFCPDLLNADSIIYSVGVGNDISFDLGIIKRFGANVHAFDPTPRSIQWLESQKLPPQFEFYPWGLADFDGTAQFLAPKRDDFVSFHIADAAESASTQKVDAKVYRIPTIMSMLNHDHIDLLKMDIEGAELGVLTDLVKNCPPIRELLVEFHYHQYPNTLPDVRRVLQLLNNCGFKVFARSPLGAELSFIRQ